MEAEYGYCEKCGKPLVRLERGIGRYNHFTGKEIMRVTDYCPELNLNSMNPSKVVARFQHTIMTYRSSDDGKVNL